MEIYLLATISDYVLEHDKAEKRLGYRKLDLMLITGHIQQHQRE